jgi:hypothetical protein
MVFAVGALIDPFNNRGHLKLLILVGTFGIVSRHMALSICMEHWQVVLAQ